MSREKAEQTLLKLYEMQKISANDMGIFDNEPREKAGPFHVGTPTEEEEKKTLPLFVSLLIVTALFKMLDIRRLPEILAVGYSGGTFRTCRFA